MIVDVHAHYHPRAYQDALSQMPGHGEQPRFGGGRHPDTDDAEHISKRIEMMDAAGVGIQVLSPAAGWAPYGQDEAGAVAAARIVNDANAELVRRHPERFKSLVSLPLPHVDASLHELERCLSEHPGIVGVNVHCSVLGRSSAEVEFEPVYAELNRRGTVVLYHPTGNGILSPFITEWGLGSPVGTSLEDIVVALHLIKRTIPARYPDITYIVPHLGGPLPMLLDRLNNQFSMQAFNLAEPPKDTARRFYYDTVGHGSHAALICAWKAFGADHILPGSDFPVLLSWETYARTFSWIREVDLPQDDIEQILERTAPSVLKL